MSPKVPADGNIATSTVLHCRASEGFARWMEAAHGSLLITLPLSGQLAVLRWNGNRVHLGSHPFDKPMGVTFELNRDAGWCPNVSRIALATRRELITFANVLNPPPKPSTIPVPDLEFDALFVPRITYHVGEVNTHDIAFCDANLCFVNTRFSCLANASEQFNFVPVWKPSFITSLVPEDRCHLNGFAIEDGVPKYATCLGRANVQGGWRSERMNGGILIDIESGELMVDGLCMPHSPKLHRGQLWVLNSGTGELLNIDRVTGRGVPTCSLPGFVRGLSFMDRYAIIGLSQIRDRHTAVGLPVHTRHSQLTTGVAIVDIRSGVLEGMFEFTRGVSEVFEVCFLPGVIKAVLCNPALTVDDHVLTAPGFICWRQRGVDVRAAE